MNATKKTKRPVFRNQLNFNPKEKGITEKYTKPSQTVPDQTMGVREILDRFSRGQQVQTLKPIWYDENDISEFEGHFDNMDSLERIDFLREVKQSIAEQQAGIKEATEKVKQDRIKKAAAEKAQRKAEQLETRKELHSVVETPKEELKK